MNDKTSARAVTLGTHIVATSCTVRDAAKEYGVAKSTVHKDVTERLREIDPELCAAVRTVLDYNLSVRHLRGGEATRKKCAKTRSEKPVD